MIEPTTSIQINPGGAVTQTELKKVLDNITAVHGTSPSFRRTTDVDIETFNITFRALAGRSTEADTQVIHRGKKRVGFNGEWPQDFRVQIESVLVSLASSKKGKEVGFKPELSQCRYVGSSPSAKKPKTADPVDVSPAEFKRAIMASEQASEDSHMVE
eukprot:SAG11_NODE_2889_length_2863_cov_11.823806_2_plen_158_part_00